MSNPNSVETDMKQIREFRDVHETAETNAFIEEMERLAKEKAANNRTSLKLENERNVNTRHEKKKDEDKDKAMAAKKNFEKEQEKMLEPSFEKQLMEEEGEAQPEKPAIDEDEWKRRVNEDLVESFSIFDIDGDGEISISELMSVMASVGNDISAEDAEDIFDVVDSNGDGKISFDEFKECMYEKMSQQTVDEDLIGAFEIFDEDKDGYISPTEIQLLFKKLGELISTDEAVEIMKDCDLNKDGLIDFEEFKAFYLKIFENQPTLAEQLVAEAEADEKQKVALAMEEKEASGYPQGEAPSPTDYK